MSIRARSVALGLMWGIPLGMGIAAWLDHLDAQAKRYVRAPGSNVVTLTGRKPA